ncbi:transmembrane protein [Cystoisospora suis]|uniref:Transmembrane protein n=1 Tax=Cystoisospora suis TaxID=483139 RepID=A0A2C6KKX5_9APIC|nr:transmembrane protein [Cystoisospora suis]
MLKANKARVVANLTYESLSIRQLELKYWMEVFKKFGVLAAFLGGFASSVSLLNTSSASVSATHEALSKLGEEKEKGGIRILGREGEEEGSYRVLFILTAGGALGFNLVLLTISVLCCLYAPGKALTGRGDTSYKSVMKVMEEMYVHCLVLFRLGLVCYLLASIFAVFRMFSFVSASMISCIFLSFGYFLTLHSSRLKQKFIPSSFTPSHLQGNPIEDIGATLTAHLDPALTGFIVDTSFGTQI